MIEIKNSINAAIKQLLTSDRELLQIDVNERTISHRLALYLEPLFPDWEVDCEYNRDHDDPKYLDITPRKVISNDIQATTVYPDIIIHKRGTTQNLVVIEMKKTTSQESDEYDLDKLQQFKHQLCYKFAIFIKLKTGGQSGIEQIDWI